MHTQGAGPTSYNNIDHYEPATFLAGALHLQQQSERLKEVMKCEASGDQREGPGLNRWLQRRARDELHVR